jgi:hypothetical protein
MSHRHLRADLTLIEMIKIRRCVWIQIVCEPKQFFAPFVHFTGRVVFQKVNGAIGFFASARPNTTSAKKAIETGTKRNKSSNDLVNLGTQV